MYMKTIKKLVSVILSFTLILTLIPSEVLMKKIIASGTTNQDMALNWLQKQFDDPKYPVSISLSEDYPDSEISNLEGKIDINTLKGYTLSDVPYINVDGDYLSGYSGEISGTWSNLQDASKYSIKVYDETDAKYEIGTTSLKTDGTWTIGEKTIHGKIFITLVDENNVVIAKSSKTPLKEIINEYEVWVYSVSDIPYLQTKLPISSDGSFTTANAKDNFKSLREGKKEVRLVRISDEKVFGSTEMPKLNLIRSYNVPIDDPVNTLGIDRRSWIYDNALAVFAFSMAGDQSRASSILSTLSQLQNGDGSLAFSYDVFTGPLDETKRSGSIAWVGDSAIKYEETFGDKSYRNLAVSIAEYLLTQQDKSTGSIKGGPDVNWYSTEHNIDAYFFFRNLGNLTGNSRYLKVASSIEHALLTYHWNASEKRFNQGINDPAAALDTNSWGSIFLEAIGRDDLAKTATDYLKNFEVNNVSMNLSENEDSYNKSFESTSNISGYKPYGNGYSDAPNVVWSEGTWGVINLFLRQGKDVSTLVNSMFAMQNADPEGGLVYTNKGYAPFPYEFHVWPSVAGTAWQYITFKDPKGIWDDNKIDQEGNKGDVLEENDTLNTAKDIGLNSFENLTLHNSTDVDYYKFTPFFTGNLKIVMEDVLDYKIEVITPTEKRHSYSETKYNVVDLDVVKDQTYYIKIYSPSGEGVISKPYSLTITDAQEFNYMLELDRLNDTFSKEQISTMQDYLSKMGFYKGIVTGEYNSTFFMSVASYQSVLNNWDPRTEMNGKFEENGLMSDRLVSYAKDDVDLGRDNEGSIYNTLFLGDTMILAWGAEGAISIGTAALMTTRWGSKLITRTLEAVSKGDVDTIGGRLLQDTLDIRAKLPSDIKSKGNMGIADITINGKKQRLVSHSRINTVDDINSLDPDIRGDFVSLKDNRTFIHRFVNSKYEIDGENAYSRIWDTEGKIMEELASQLGDNWNASGTIDIFTERNPCQSCSGVMDQFQERYPNIRLNVYYDKEKFTEWK